MIMNKSTALHFNNNFIFVEKNGLLDNIQRQVVTLLKFVFSWKLSILFLSILLPKKPLLL